MVLALLASYCVHSGNYVEVRTDVYDEGTIVYIVVTWTEELLRTSGRAGTTTGRSRLSSTIKLSRSRLCRK
jgi:hypothetical protein